MWTHEQKGQKIVKLTGRQTDKERCSGVRETFLAKSKWVGVSFIKTYSMESPSKQKRNFQKAFFQQR